MNAAAAALVVLNGRQAFDPRASLFAHNEPGFWYDPSDLSSMYQDSAGTTPVTAVEQAVGLILDKSKGLVLGPELVTNGGFSNGSTDWSAGPVTPSGWTFAGGVCSGSNAAGGYQSVGQVVSGRSYIAEFTISNYSSGAVSLSNSDTGGFGEIFSSAGVKRQIFTATATGTVGFVRRISNFNGDIDNFSVRELAGNHAIQPGATNRPILRSRYNLLTWSEQFDNAAWTKDLTTVTANTVAAPDGTLTADSIDFLGTSASDRIRQDTVFAAVNGQSIVGSVWLRADTAKKVWLRIERTGPADVEGVEVDVTTTWQRFSFTHSTTWTGTTNLRLTLNQASVTGVIYAWGADLRRANDTYLPYQRIAAATDYDTVGFPVYLAFDGSDDSLYTGGNVDFSATDKMTVWAGVTKLSDATRGIVVELGNNAAAGGFHINAPHADANATFSFTSTGTVFSGHCLGTPYAAPQTRVLTGIGDIAADVANLQVDGALFTNSNDQGTGNYASAVLNIGRRNNASLPFNGRLYQLIGRGAATSAALITQADRWVAGKQGRSL